MVSRVTQIKKVTDLPTASELNSNDFVEIAQNSISKKLPISILQQYGTSGYSGYSGAFNFTSYTTLSSGSYNLTSLIPIVYTDFENTVVLPATPVTDESHFIVNLYSSENIIDGNGKNIFLDGVSASTVTIPPYSSFQLHFNSAKDSWYII